MKPVRAKISALGTFVPPRVLDNFELEKMVDTTNEWILARTGIRERHLVDKGVAASDLAVGAARNMAERHGVDLNQVEALIVATVTPDMMYPSTACLVQHKLNLPDAWGFDLSAAPTVSCASTKGFGEGGKRTCRIAAELAAGSTVHSSCRPVALAFAAGRFAFLAH